MKKTKLKWSEMNKKQRILFVIDWLLRCLLILIFVIMVGAFVFSCFGTASGAASAYADDGSSGQVASTFSSSANTAYDETGLELYNINLLYCPDYKITKSGITAQCSNGVFVNTSGESIEYNECSAVIGGNTIKFAPKAADKKLFDFLVAQIASQK